VPIDVTGVAPATGAVSPEIAESVTADGAAAAVAGNVIVRTPVPELNEVVPPVTVKKWVPRLLSV